MTAEFSHSMLNLKDIFTILFYRTLKALKSLPRSLPVTIITGNYYDDQMPGPLNKVGFVGF